MGTKFKFYILGIVQQWTVPQLSNLIIYNCTWSILIQQIRIILSADNLTQTIQKKAHFLFVINVITRSKKICRLGRSLKICGTIHYEIPLYKIRVHGQYCIFIHLRKLPTPPCSRCIKQGFLPVSITDSFKFWRYWEEQL